MVMFTIEGALAVTLPSTSYQSYDQSYDETGVPSGILIKGSYLAQGTGDYSKCTGDGSGSTSDGTQECSECCQTQYSRDVYDECHSFCWSGQPPLTPLDAPLWFMLALAALGTVVTLSVVQRSEESRNLR